MKYYSFILTQDTFGVKYAAGRQCNGIQTKIEIPRGSLLESNQAGMYESIDHSGVILNCNAKDVKQVIFPL